PRVCDLRLELRGMQLETRRFALAFLELVVIPKSGLDAQEYPVSQQRRVEPVNHDVAKRDADIVERQIQRVVAREQERIKEGHLECGTHEPEGERGEHMNGKST